MGRRNNLLKGVRSQHWFGLMTQELERLALSDWEVVAPTGRGHPKLIVRHGDKVFRTPVPSSERGGGDHKYLVNRLRKFVENLK